MTSPVVSLTAKSLLKRVDARIVSLRRALSHDHRDAARFEPFGGAPAAQAERAYLRMVAHLLHVERAHQRGRLHCFATREDQAAWLARMENHRCPRAARYAGLPDDATLAKLRIGELLDLPRPPGAP